MIDAATLIGLAAGIGWIMKMAVKENFTSDPSESGELYEIHRGHGWVDCFEKLP